MARLVQTSLRPEVPSAVRDSVAVLALDVESDLAFLSHDDRRVKEIDERLRALPANRFVEVNRAGVLRNSDAKVRAVQGEVEIAVKSMRTYFPGCIPSRNIALFYERAGRADEAGSAWREVVGDSYCPLPSALVAAHLALGEIALQSGDLATAKAEAAQVRQLWPTPDEDLLFTKRLVALEAAAP
jgi:hypothetical protein